MLPFCLKEKQPHFLLLLEFQKLEKIVVLIQIKKTKQKQMPLNMGATNQTHRIEISSYRWSKEGDDIVACFWFEVICHANRLKSQRSVKRGQFPLFLIHNQSRFFTKKNRLSKRIEPFFLRGQRRIYCHVASLILCQWFHSVAKYSVYLLLTFEKWFELK